MNDNDLDPAALVSNPFSTRFISPTTVDYLFPKGTDAARLVTKLREADWWGQIIGPHGSGKTALLHSLAPLLEEAGRRVELCVLHDSERRLRIAQRTKSGWNRHTQVVVDGYEQLGWFSRVMLKRNCRSRGAGLLVSAHASVGLPAVWETETSLELARTLVARLLPQQRVSRITAEDVSCAFSAHQGNLREMLMSLYDVYEERSGGADDQG
ncbi:MAG: hypothetical protein H8E44_13355 [Planctomycetes bacterium]|nr:hypothetical protein [Planctomycetota bacterium]MBL7037508.1 hypothetical protein [Pirellulaceae bacterium]